MVKRQKRLEKQIKGLEKVKKEHQDKIKFLKGNKDTTKEYWEKEVEGFDKQIEEIAKKLIELREKKKNK
ncbi:MAG: hypothetical protein ACOCUU_03095 [Nanoarchaeota archaeon]